MDKNMNIIRENIYLVSSDGVKIEFKDQLS